MSSGMKSGPQEPIADFNPPIPNPVARCSSPGDQHDCEGRCAQEVAEQMPTPLPVLQLSVLLYIQLAEPITFSIILPFIVKLIEETGITGGDMSKIGYYAGFVESIFFLTQACMVLQWGRISDRIGRRPVILTGLFGLGMSMLSFGLSHSLWAIMVSRALAGSLNANAGILKCMMSEITDESNIAQGFAFIPMTWAVGNTIGPLIGGLLQHPYERFGGPFEHTFWRSNPYFLPCLVSALYSTSAFVLSFCLLQETAPNVVAPKLPKDGTVKLYNGLQNDTVASDTPPSIQSTENTPLVPPSKTPDTSLRALLTPRVTVVMLNYSVLAVLNLGFIAIQPLFLSVPISNGGLGMPPSTIGICLSVAGFANGIVCVLFFARLERRFGLRNILTGSVTAYMACYVLWPVMNALARAEGGLGWGVWVVWAIQLMPTTLTQMAYSCVFIFLSAAAPSRAALGATNGVAQTVTSFVRAMVPAGASALFAFSMEHRILGGSLVYVVFSVFTVCTIAVSRLLPARPWKRVED